MQIRTLRALVLSAAIAVFLPANAAEVDIPYTEYTLDNGLRLIVHEDDKAPIVAVNVWYHVGSKNEKAGKTGFAHLFEHLMFNGTENYDDEYFKPFERVGATDMNGTTNFDRTNYFQNVPKTALDMALWMESDRMGHLLGAITQEKLDEQRGVVQNEKRQGENQPYGKVWNRVFEGVFPEGHPYSWSVIGSMEDLNAASLDDVHEWFKTYYGPNNAVLAIAGDVDAEQVYERVNHFFGDIPPGPPITKPAAWEVRLDGDKYEVMQDRVPQARVYKVWGGPRWGTLDTAMLDFASDVLASGKSSRLYKRLVYDEQIATDVSSFVFSNEIGGIFAITATAQPGGDLAEIEAAIDEEVAKLMQDGITDEEMKRVKAARRGSFVRGIERVGGFGGKSDVLAEHAVYGGDPDAYKVQLDRFANADEETVLASVDAWLTAGSYNLKVVPFPDLVASTAGADRSSVPATESFPEVSFNEFERGNLSNGLEVIVAPRSSVPIVNMRMQFDAGYASDQFTNAGTSSLAMSMLDEGTKKRTALEISDDLASLSASIGAGSNLDSSFVSLNALSDTLDDALDIYADVILNPSFPDNELERLRKQRYARIQQEKNQPVGMALRTFPKLLYGEGHAYAMPLTGSGTEASVADITRDSLLDYHETWFKPNNATLIVVGDTTMAELKPKLEKRFGRWQPGNVPTKNIGSVGLPDQQRVFLIDRPDSEQSIIIAANLAPPAGELDEIAVETMNEIIGGSFTSRVNMNLREDKSWAYGAFTFLIDAEGQRPFAAYAPVQTDKTMESMAEIRRELTEYLSSNPATADEMNKVKDNNTLQLPGRWETSGAVLGDIGEIVTYGLPDDYWDNYADRVRGLTLDQIKDVADDVIRPDNLTWVVVGDRDEIESRIRELELGEITEIDADGNVVVPAAAN